MEDNIMKIMKNNLDLLKYKVLEVIEQKSPKVFPDWITPCQERLLLRLRRTVLDIQWMPVKHGP